MALAAIFLAATLAAACSAGPSAEGPANTIHATGLTTVASSEAPTIVTTPPSSVDEVFFPQWKPPKGYPGGLAPSNGELVLDDKGCLRLRYQDYYAVVPVWPPDYEAEISDDGELRNLNGEGEVEARLGDWVVLGGNGIVDSLMEPSRFVGGQKTVRELQERCPGRYFGTRRGIEVREGR